MEERSVFMECCNVLIVDDDLELANLMGLKLRKEAPHLTFTAVGSGRECIERLLGTEEYHCVLSDYQMPGMDGMQLMHEIRSRGMDVPFIFVTGQGNEQVARDAFKGGAYDYFTKDLVGFAYFAKIINSVEQAVRQRNTERLRAQAEDALLHEKNKLEAILANIGDGISIQDRDFRILYQNPAHIGLGGEHAGELCYVAYGGRDTVCPGCPIERCFETGEVHSLQKAGDNGNGNRVIEITASPLKDGAGNVIAGIEVVREITGRRLVEELR